MEGHSGVLTNRLVHFLSSMCVTSVWIVERQCAYSNSCVGTSFTSNNHNNKTSCSRYPGKQPSIPQENQCEPEIEPSKVQAWWLKYWYTTSFVNHPHIEHMQTTLQFVSLPSRTNALDCSGFLQERARGVPQSGLTTSFQVSSCCLVGTLSDSFHRVDTGIRLEQHPNALICVNMFRRSPWVFEPTLGSPFYRYKTVFYQIGANPG